MTNVKSKTLTDYTEDDLRNQLRGWRADNPHLQITKEGPVKLLPLQLRETRPYRVMLAEHQFSMVVEFEERPLAQGKPVRVIHCAKRC